MDQDTVSLDQLNDIVEPARVSWWPLATGWWILFFIIAVSSTILLFRQWQIWRANAYRRSALQELSSATTVAQIDAILKRTALCVFARSDIAGLHGEAWTHWLASKIKTSLPERISTRLIREPFQPETGDDISDVLAFAATWIREHETPC